jgi:hypothetical protein
MMVMIWHLVLQLLTGDSVREGWRSRLKKLGRKKKADDVNSFFIDLGEDARVCDFCV